MENYAIYQKYKEAKEFGYNLREIFERDPHDILDFCQRKQYPLLCYHEGYKMSDLLGYLDMCTINYAFTVNVACEEDANDDYYIFYHDNLTVPRVKFAICHELGHILHGDVWRRSASLCNRDPQRGDRLMENAANICAAYALDTQRCLDDNCPPQYLCNICGIGKSSAQYLLKLIQRLNDAQKQRYFERPIPLFQNPQSVLERQD